MASYAEDVTEPEPPAARPVGYVQLVIGLLVFVVASFGALLAAGELGTSGVFLAVLIEAAAIAWIYRWCEA
jgi:uncharacterized membrane protein YiaA